jgi:MoaA/NifB/PqqE/SkfB family radical SAM enzyme
MHCYVSAHPGAGRAISAETVEQALTLFASLGIFDLRLTGGEATIHPEFEGILNRARMSGFRLRLITNGKRLLRASAARDWLRQIASCWVSAYGPTDAIHRSISQGSAPPLSEILATVGDFAREGHDIGVSVLLVPESASEVETLLDRAISAGIRRVRLLPVEPEGRAMGLPDVAWAGWPDELRDLYQRLISRNYGTSFDVLTMNDPFDVADRFPAAEHSCLLRTRRMPSVVPNGDVYPCCFTVYDPERRLGNVSDPEIRYRLRGIHPIGDHSTPCRALESGFWQGVPDNEATCPISAVTLIRHDA